METHKATLEETDPNLRWLGWDANFIWGWRTITKPNHLSTVSSILPEVRDTIRAPASNHLPSLSVRVPQHALAAGGITGRWPGIPRKTRLKSSDYILIVPFIHTKPCHNLDLSSAIVTIFLSVCIFSRLAWPLNIRLEENDWEMVVLNSPITPTHTHAHSFKSGTQYPHEDVVTCMGQENGMFLGFGFHHAALRELCHPHGLKSLSQ